MGTPFPTIHTKANEAAAEKAEEARLLRDRANELLSEIDALLEPMMAGSAA